MVYTVTESDDNVPSPLKRILTLDEQLKRYQYAYYVKSSQPVADMVFDALFRELEELHEKHPEYRHLETVVTQPMPYVSDSFTLVEHLRPMQSIQTVMSDESDKLKKFMGQVSSESVTVDYVGELKFDGLAISLIYEDGRLVRALTRGNNNKGELVTQTVAMIPSVPLRLAFPLKGTTEVRGEVTLRKGALETINRLSSDGKGFTSLRNAASGLIRRNKLFPELAKHLQFHAYDCFIDSGHGDRYFKTQCKKLSFMHSIGFSNCGKHAIEGIRTFQELLGYYKLIQNSRDELPFEIDGIVIKVDDLKIQDRLGSGNRVQNWSRAFKFDAVVKRTTVEKIDVTVGATGMLTPVVYITPVEINGVTISKASVSNFKKLNTLNIAIGSEVMIKRSGDTIPEIVECLSSTPSNYVPPLHCPYCGALVEGDEEGQRFCSGTMTCPKQTLGRIQRFFNKDNVKINGVSDSTLEFLFESRMIHEPIDVFCIGLRNAIGAATMSNGQFDSNLNKLEAIALDQLSFNGLMSERAIKTLLKNIRNVEPVRLYQVIAGLGIKHVSTERAKAVASFYKTLDQFMLANMNELSNLEGISVTTANSILSYLKQPKARELRLLPRLGLTILPEEERTDAKLPLHGKAYAITGTLNIRRQYYEQQLVELGAKIHKTVLPSTAALVVGASPGPKYELAKKLGVLCITESDLEQIIQNAKPQ